MEQNNNKTKKNISKRKMKSFLFGSVFEKSFGLSYLVGVVGSFFLDFRFMCECLCVMFYGIKRADKEICMLFCFVFFISI